MSYSAFLFVALCSLIHKNGAIGYKYYVSNNGSDANGDGSISSPWATIQNAQRNIQKLIPSLSKTSFNGNITIHIDGSYIGPFIFGVNDSLAGFQHNNYVIYKALDANHPAYTYGAYDITSSWTKYTRNGLNLYTTNLKPQQSELPSNGDIFELFIGSTRVSMTKSMLLHYDSVNVSSKTMMTNTKMIPNIVDIMATDYSMNLMVLIYEHWTSSYHYVTNINYNPSSGKIALKLETCPTQYISANDTASGRRFYVLNNIQLFNKSNQFYYNKTNMNLYLLTNITLNPKEAVRFAKDTEIISIKGQSADNKVERIMFNGLHLQYSAIDFSDCISSTCTQQSAAFLQTATLHTTNADGIIFDNITISHTGGYAIWLNEGTINSQVINSRIQHLGAGGIRIGVNSGDVVPGALLTQNILISNNYIMDGGFVYEAGCGILAQSFAYSNITHNEIANFKYSGISTGWSWNYGDTSVSNNIVAYNMIYNIGQYVLSDMGCIYTLGMQLNCVYENNICHDVYSYDYGAWGTYTDQSSRYLLWRNNIVYRTKNAGHHQHYGLDNIFVNNIYAFNALDEGQHDGSIRSSQHYGTCDYDENEGACSSFIFITNIVYINDTFNYDILGDPHQTLWKNMTLDGNTYWSVKQGANVTFPDQYTIQKWSEEGKDVQNALQDPMFVDPLNYNFDLKLGSPAISLGFHPIDTQCVGPDW